MSTETKWVVSVNDGAGWRNTWGPFKEKPKADDKALSLLRGYPHLKPNQIKVITHIHSKVEDKGWRDAI